MNIVLSYDSIAVETNVWINETMVNRSDHYGFLYPVRRYPIQTWLEPSGSWPGLAYSLQEIARGEQVFLQFCGQERDYQSLSHALVGIPQFTLSFRKQDSSIQLKQYLHQADELLAQIQKEDRKSKTNLYTQFPKAKQEIQNAIKIPEVPWYLEIRSEEDFVQADGSQVWCCMIYDSYLDSFEKLDKIWTLTRAMRRSGDMLCCCISDAQKREEYQRYANQRHYTGIRFDLEKQGISYMKVRYEMPQKVQAEHEKHKRVDAVLKHYIDLKKGLYDDLAVLAQENSRSYKTSNNDKMTQIRSKIACLELIDANYFSPYHKLVQDLTRILKRSF